MRGFDEVGPRPLRGPRTSNFDKSDFAFRHGDKYVNTHTRHRHGAAALNSGRALRPLVGRSVVAAASGPATCAATADGGKRQPRTRASCGNMAVLGVVAHHVASESPGRPRRTPDSAQCIARCRQPASLRPTTPRLCGSCVVLVTRRPDGVAGRMSRLDAQNCHHLPSGGLAWL